MGELKSLRIERKLTQNQAADILGVSLRSYKSYENDEKKADSIKYKYMLEKISEINPIDEENGIVDIDYIKRKCSVVFDKYNVNFCYLFGSYSKGKAKPTSDVDLLISTDATGLKFYGLVEDIRTALHKKVDVLDINQLKDNFELTQEVLLDSMLFRMIQISENAKKLSDEYKLHRGNVPWNAIYGLRNRIVHDYGNVDRKRHR